MTADVDIARVATVIGHPTRAAMLSALHEGAPLSAGELARRANVAPSTASGHLTQLAAAGLVDSERHGRCVLYRVGSDDVARAWEALSVIAPRRRVDSLRTASLGAALVEARTCYDHLAGRLGVAVTDALLSSGALAERDGVFVLGEDGRAFDRLGVDVAAIRGRRPLVLRCLDWSQRRPHLAGALGAALASRSFDAGWIERLPAGRAVRVTEAGRRDLSAALGLDLARG